MPPPPKCHRWHLNNPSIAKSRQLLGDFVPHTPYRGSAPGPRWGISIPRNPELAPSKFIFWIRSCQSNRGDRGVHSPPRGATDVTGRCAPLPNHFRHLYSLHRQVARALTAGNLRDRGFFICLNRNVVRWCLSVGSDFKLWIHMSFSVSVFQIKQRETVCARPLDVSGMFLEYEWF